MPRIQFSISHFDPESFNNNVGGVLEEENARNASILSASIAQLSEVSERYENPEDYAKYVVAEFIGCSRRDNSGFCRRNPLSDLIKSVSEPEKQLLEKFVIDNIRSLEEYEGSYSKSLAGSLYLHGIGVEKDSAKAVTLFELAANQGNAVAQCSLGVCYKSEIGVEKNLAKAIDLFELAAGQGNVGAQCNLAICYRSGIGVKKDLTRAAELYRLGAEQEIAIAQYNLGLCYKDGIGVEKDAAEAVRLYQLAADQEYAPAQCSLGVCHQNGIGVMENRAEAVRLFELAADQGYYEAQFNLGVCHQDGIGTIAVNIDNKKAVKLYQLAADQEYAPAQFNLAVCYYNGTGVERNDLEAVKFCALAADQGHVRALSKLDSYYTRFVNNVTDHSSLLKFFVNEAGKEKGNFWLGKLLNFNPDPSLMSALDKDDIIKLIDLVKTKPDLKDKLNYTPNFIVELVQGENNNLSLNDLSEIRGSLQELGEDQEYFELNYYSTQIISDLIVDRIKEFLEREKSFTRSDFKDLELSFKDDGAIECRKRNRSVKIEEGYPLFNQLLPSHFFSEPEKLENFSRAKFLTEESYTFSKDDLNEIDSCLSHPNTSVSGGVVKRGMILERGGRN